jgi:hypothetical protein
VAPIRWIVRSDPEEATPAFLDLQLFVPMEPQPPNMPARPVALLALTSSAYREGALVVAQMALLRQGSVKMGSGLALPFLGTNIVD